MWLELLNAFFNILQSSFKSCYVTEKRSFRSVALKMPRMSMNVPFSDSEIIWSNAFF